MVCHIFGDLLAKSVSQAFEGRTAEGISAFGGVLEVGDETT
jgi:hypothetical protein